MTVRFKVTVRGLVQGIGFRPRIACIARERDLSGLVRNERGAAVIEIQGAQHKIEAFIDDLPRIVPIGASLDSIETVEIPVNMGDADFVIAPSLEHGKKRFSIPPDLAICPKCVEEFFDPDNRRYRYPFITCGSCGPRYSYLYDMPHDRGNSTMADFPLCEACRAEYEDPSDRRYHIEGISCPDCGPRVSGLEEGLAAILSGAVAAIKGIGGFHLACLADDENAVGLLRSRKKRPSKPFAVMYPNLAALEEAAKLLDSERDALTSSESPIVLVEKTRFSRPPAESVAPHNASIGVMIPYSPLHLLILSSIGRPLVMTSANLPGDPLIIDDESAKIGLEGVADAVIGHNRRILKRADDGIVMVCAGGVQSLRKGRGSAPRPIKLAKPCRTPILAVGAELKSTVSVVSGDDLATSPHIGDIESPAAFDHFRRTILDMLDYYDVEPAMIVCDLHPDYESTRFAEEFSCERNIPLRRVQHHHAHLLASVLGEGLLYESGKHLGLVLDGTGYGEDGTIWGGELVLSQSGHCERLDHLSHFPLPGAEAAIREPWRIAAGLGLLQYNTDVISKSDIETVCRIARDRELSPLTSSCGRLFDAAAALCGFDGRVSYEGEAAIWLEALASEALRDGAVAERGSKHAYTSGFDGRALLEILAEKVGNPHRVLRSVLCRFALDFHIDLAESLASIASQYARGMGLQRLYLSGGVFQNRIFTDAILAALGRREIQGVLSRRVSVNDACISIGQAAAGILADLEAEQCASPVP
jgi:hydrogenase maturation protein HypF